MWDCSFGKAVRISGEIFSTFYPECIRCELWFLLPSFSLCLRCCHTWLSSLPWEQLVDANPLQGRPHALLGQEHLLAAELAAACSGTHRTADTDRGTPEQHACPKTLLLWARIQASALLRSVDTAAKFLRAGAITIGVVGLGAGFGGPWEPHDWICHEPSWEGFARLEALGLFCLFLA